MAEQYSIQAETLMKSAVEDYVEVIKVVQASNANMTLIKGVKITLNGKPRRLVDVGDLRTGETEKKLQDSSSTDKEKYILSYKINTLNEINQ